MAPPTKHEEDFKAVDYKVLKISSPAFEENGLIPQKYTCDGADVNPPLDIDGLPVEAVSLVIIVEDEEGSRTHWLIWNIPATHHIKEGDVPGVEGRNDFDQHQYNGPCSPPGEQRYFLNYMLYKKY